MRSFRRNNRINYSTIKANTRKVIGWKISAFESPSYSIYRHVTTETPNVEFVNFPNNTSDVSVYEAFTKAFLKARLDGNFTLYLKLKEKDANEDLATVALTFTTSESATFCAVSFTAGGEVYTSKQYYVDGEYNDLVLRLLDIPEDQVNPDKYFEIDKKTYGVLDLNPNLGMYKGTHLLLLNIPLLSNISWPMDGKALIKAYYIEPSSSN